MYQGCYLGEVDKNLARLFDKTVNYLIFSG
jgi:hypothetical protein